MRTLRQDIAVPTIILGTGDTEPIAQAVELLRVDRVYHEAPIDQLLAPTLAMAICGVGLDAVGRLRQGRIRALPGIRNSRKIRSAKSTQPAHISHWWTHFGAAELNQLMDSANIDNLDIAVAVAQLAQADAQARITGAALFPTIGYADNNSRSQFSGTTIPGQRTRRAEQLIQ